LPVQKSNPPLGLCRATDDVYVDPSVECGIRYMFQKL